MPSPRYTLSHTISHSRIWSLDVTVPQRVSQAHQLHGITQSPTCYLSHLTYSHTQPVGMTRFRTVTLCYTASHEVTQPHTTSGITHNFTVLHTHTISLCHTHTPSFGVTPDTHSLSCTQHTQPSVLSDSPLKATRGRPRPTEPATRPEPKP